MEGGQFQPSLWGRCHRGGPESQATEGTHSPQSHTVRHSSDEHMWQLI